MSVSNARIGFVGLGAMGRAMVRRLHAAGAALTIWNRTTEVAADMARAAPGCAVAETPAGAARASEVVIINVFDTHALDAVCAGETGVTAGFASPVQTDRRLVVDMDTSSATATRRLAEAFAETGVGFVDAPVSGGEIGARDGTLSIMAGGAEADVARLRPIFEVLGENITHVGDVGAGQVAKAANQAIVGLTLAAVAEALALARNAGVDPAKVRRALSGGFADSRILQLHGQRMVDRAFAPGGRIAVQRKDLAQILDLGAEVGQSLPSCETNLGLWDAAIAAGHEDLDHSAIIASLDPGWGVDKPD